MDKIITDLKSLIDPAVPWGLETRLKEYIIKLEKEAGGSKPRTETQNNALHLFLTQLSDVLNEAGLDMQTVIKVPITWNVINAKEYLWRPIQKALLKKDSTTQLTKNEVSQVYEHLNRLMGQKFGVHVPFPDKHLIDQKSDANMMANKLRSDNSYPISEGETKF